jgi:hypothetical protein
MAFLKMRSLVALFLAFAAAGCGGAGGGPAAPQGAGSAETINRTKCGVCHAPWAPGEHTKAELEPILKKHRGEGRANLSDSDWALMTEYLAKK